MLATYKEKPVAVKKMINTNSYPMTKYVQREIDIMQKLNHPNIIKVCFVLFMFI